MKQLFTLAALLFLTNFLFLAKATDFGGNVNANTTLTLANSPYTVTSNIFVSPGITLTIENGVEVRFGSNMYMEVRGTLNATGVHFTANSATPTAGFYQGIYVSYEWAAEYGTVNLNNCVIEYAQTIWVRKGQLTLTNNSVIKNFSGVGINIYDNGLLNIDNSTITATNYPIYFQDNNAGNFVVGNNVNLTGNTNDFIFLNFNNIDADFRLPNTSVPYYYDSDLEVTTTGKLTIDPGVQLLGSTGAYININGKIKANGTAIKPIVFSARTGNDYWLGFNINNSSIDTACILNNCRFEKATYDYRPYSAMGIFDASPTLSNCVFSGNNYNMEITGRSFPTFTKNTFGPSIRNNGYSYNIMVDLNAEPSFTNDTIRFNSYESRAIGIIGSTVSHPAHMKQLNFVGINNITYLLTDDVTIAASASLQIDSGVVVKCNHNGADIIAYGPLTGIGTESKPIVFTHRNDDRYGNPLDTYGDGTTTISNSNSGRLIINSAGLSTLDHWKIHYAGYYYYEHAIYLNNNNILKNSLVTNSYRAVHISNNAQVINSRFEDINYHAINRYVNKGQPVLLNNTVSNVPSIGICIVGFATDTVTIKKQDFAGQTNVAYLLEDNLEIPANAVISIEPGVVFKSINSGGLIVNGALSAAGTNSEKVIFTSLYDDSASGDTNLNGTGNAPSAGNWQGITFNDGSLDHINQLKHCEIRYSSYSITMTNCKVNIDNALINFSSTNGLRIYGTANPIIANSYVYNMAQAPIYMDMFASPTFSGITVGNVPQMGIAIRGGTLVGTIPVRSFAGVDTVTYIMNEHFTVNDSLIIPKGLTFKTNTDARWYINGKLKIEGTATNPVVFTSYQDDKYGKPSDLELNGLSTQYNRGSHFYFYDQSNDNSVIDHAIFRYCYSNAVKCYNASPTISNTLFESFANQGIALSGTSNPNITNCKFNNISFPVATSLTTFPSNESGNAIMGTTGRAIRVFDETLSQNVIVGKKTFAGIANIPYIFGEYTIGTSSVVTIDAGVVCKFLPNGYINIYKGLKANGGTNNNDFVIFTSDNDDFYGGDTYGNGDTGLPSKTHWYGIYFLNEAIDSECALTNCVFKHATSTYYARGAVTMDNASPSINGCSFENNYHGIVTNNTSLPTITGCDFSKCEPTYGNAVWNRTPTNIVTAENCWWNNATGPYNAATNPTGLGERITDGVDFTPWTAMLGKPANGDVSMNGEVKPYDASLVLQHVVGGITLTAKQLTVADVSGNGEVTSFDASQILKYSVGIISFFGAPAQIDEVAEKRSLSIWGNDVHPSTSQFDVDIELSTPESISALDLKFATNPIHVKLTGLQGVDFPANVTMAYGYNEKSGNVAIALASATDLNLNQNKIRLTFDVADAGIKASALALTSMLANEDKVESPIQLAINTSQVVSGIADKEGSADLRLTAEDGAIYLVVPSDINVPQLTVTITDLTGRTVLQSNIPLDNHKGQKIKLNGNIASPGVYVVSLTGNQLRVDQKLLVK